MMPVRKHSRKRDAILSCVRGTTCHPTAEWVYTQLKPTIPDLSLATVYRNLAMFKDEGTIDSVGVYNGLERFVCTACSSVYDVPQDALPEEFVRSAEQATGGEIAAYQLSYYGICSNCKNSK